MTIKIALATGNLRGALMTKIRVVITTTNLQ